MSSCKRLHFHFYHCVVFLYLKIFDQPFLFASSITGWIVHHVVWTANGLKFMCTATAPWITGIVQLNWPEITVYTISCVLCPYLLRCPIVGRCIIAIYSGKCYVRTGYKKAYCKEHSHHRCIYAKLYYTWAFKMVLLYEISSKIRTTTTSRDGDDTWKNA